jgi:hypothetical protein
MNDLQNGEQKKLKNLKLKMKKIIMGELLLISLLYS